MSRRGAPQQPRRVAGPTTIEVAANDVASSRRFSVLSSDGALYVTLLILVWGLTVSMRGMWQDDTLLLRLARTFQGHGLVAALTPVVSPLRRLYTLPFRLALETPQPIWVLHAMFGLVWMGQALSAGWLCRLLLPGRHLVRFLAICLTLTATSDYLTDNLTALGYNIAALTVLLAIGFALRYLDDGRARWLVPSCLSIAISIWTLDLAIPALPFVPLLILWHGGAKSWKRVVVLGLAWCLTLAPAVPIEWRFLHDPYGYAAVAMKPLPVMTRIDRALSLFRENFAPWRWVFSRPVWYPRPAAVIPAPAMWLASSVGAGWFTFRAWRLPRAERSSGTLRTLSLVGLFACMAFVSNAAYSGLQMAEIHYRTHILSRTLASLALAILIGWAVHRWPRHRAIWLFVPALFVGFGVWGGLERQDLWVSTWRLHERELLSIVKTAPALTPGTSVILRSRPTPNVYLATEADYLATCWLILLYDDPTIHTLRLNPERGTGCRATTGALECWHENEADCFAAGTCKGDRFPYEKLVIMDYDDADGTYKLLPSLSGDPLLEGTSLTGESYRPNARILQRPLTRRQRALLLQ